MITARHDHGMTVYKGLFVADHDLHNYCGCAGRVFVYGGQDGSTSHDGLFVADLKW
jgi:hypothetical protein